VWPPSRGPVGAVCRHALRPTGQYRARLRDAHAGSQPAHERERFRLLRTEDVCAAGDLAVHCEGNPEIHSDFVKPFETVAGDADDLERISAHQNLLSHDVPIAREEFPPAGIAEHHDRRVSRGRRIVGDEGSAQFRADAQHAEIIAGHQFGKGSPPVYAYLQRTRGVNIGKCRALVRNSWYCRHVNPWPRPARFSQFSW